eukprot:29006_1
MNNGLWSVFQLCSRQSQQVIHEFIVMMFSVFGATKATEYISIEMAKLDRKHSTNIKTNKIWTRILLISMFFGNIIASIGHFLILYSGTSNEICDHQSRLLQFGPVLSMSSKTTLLFMENNTNKNTSKVFIPFLLAILSTQLVPATSYGRVDEEYQNWCWIKGVTQIDFLCRFFAYYGQLLILTIYTLYILITTTSPTVKSFISLDYYKQLKPEILFSLGLIICFIIPSLTRFYQYIYPNTYIPWVVVSLTTGCISFTGVVDVLIYRFYLKYSSESQIFVENNKPVVIKQHSTDIKIDLQKQRTLKLIDGFFHTSKEDTTFPEEMCQLCAIYAVLHLKFLTEFKKNGVIIEYDKTDISDVIELEQLICQLRYNIVYNKLFDQELAALIFAVYYEIFQNYGPLRIEHYKLMLCRRYCDLLKSAFNKVYKEKQNDDISKLYYHAKGYNLPQQMLSFQTYSLWRNNIVDEELYRTRIKNNFVDLLRNGKIKSFKIDWKFRLYNDDQYIEEEDIFNIIDDELKYKMIQYDNIWILEPFIFHKKRSDKIQQIVGWAEPKRINDKNINYM